MPIRDYSTFKSPLPHPGDHLRMDFLRVYRLTPGKLAKAMGLSDRARIERLIRGRQRLTADTALRLGKVFGTSADMWLNMQAQHDLSKAALAVKDQLETLAVLQAPEAA